MEIREMLTALTTLPGPSGFEGPALRQAQTLLAPLVESTRTDALGNLLGYRRSQVPDAQTVMLAAHLDEIGFMVTGHDKGYVRFCLIGGIDTRMLPNREIALCVDPPITGVVACLPPHVQQPEDHDKSIPADELFIDVGLCEEEAPVRVPIGTQGVFTGAPFALGTKQLSGHSFDDRACFAILLRTLALLGDKPLAVHLVVCGSAQEEVGARGAKVAAFDADPDIFFAVDVTHAATPDAPKDRTFTLGGGPCIGMGPGCHRRVARELVETAKAAAIPHQIEVMEGHTGTDAWPAQVGRSGVATAVVSLPLKYMHTPIETLHLDDMENTAQLLAHFLLSLKAGGGI